MTDPTRDEATDPSPPGAPNPGGRPLDVEPSGSADGIQETDSPGVSPTDGPEPTEASAVGEGESPTEGSGDGDGSSLDRKLVRFEASPGTIDVTDHPLRFAFGHGRHHGEWRVDSEPYQEYLRQKAEEEALLSEAERHRAAMDEERGVRSRAAELRGRLAAKHVEARHAAEAIDRAEARVTGADRAIDEARDELRGIKGRGSWTYVLLYGVAGAVFIAGDVALAKYTVSTALRLIGWEGWVFAVGLALLAFVLKPVYDRLVEDRYHEGVVRPFTWSILATALFVGGFLLLMGGYRADFMQSNVGLTQNRAELALVEQQLDRARDLEQTERVAALEARRDQLDADVREAQEAILTNRMGYWALVFAQLLFAMAGAICLGLATRNLRDWRHLRRPLSQKLGKPRTEADPKRAGELFRRKLEAEAALAEARAALRTAEEDVERLAAEAAVLESEAEALERLETSRAGFASAQGDLKEVRKQIYEHLYRTGYAMGEKLPAPEVVSTGDGLASGLPELAGGSSSGPSGRRRHRLFLAVREAVRRAAVPPSEDA